jgi:hypothetical protein
VSIFYSSTSSLSKGFPSRKDATKAYLEHYGRYLVLSYILRTGDRDQKQQATTELDICERKMRYWESRSDYNIQAAIRGISQLKRQMQQMVIC